MDQWVQKLSLLVALITGAFALHAMRKGVDCWCPAQFSSSHVKYTNTLCASNISERFEARSLYSDTGVDPSGPHAGPYQLIRRSTFISEDNALLKVIAGELLLISALYALIKCILSTSNFDVLFPGNLHLSYSKTPVYIIVQLAGCCLWIFFAVFTYSSYNEVSFHDASVPFICNFEIRHITKIHSYSVQCIDAGVLGLKSAVSLNVGLCVVVAFSKLVHLVAIFGIQPLLKINKIAAKMAERKLIQTEGEIGLRFGYSDLYFAMLVTGRDISQQLRPRLDKKKELLYDNSRPPSMVC